MRGPPNAESELRAQRSQLIHLRCYFAALTGLIVYVTWVGNKDYFRPCAPCPTLRALSLSPLTRWMYFVVFSRRRVLNSLFSRPPAASFGPPFFICVFSAAPNLLVSSSIPGQEYNHKQPRGPECGWDMCAVYWPSDAGNTRSKLGVNDCGCGSVLCQFLSMIPHEYLSKIPKDQPFPFPSIGDKMLSATLDTYLTCCTHR